MQLRAVTPLLGSVFCRFNSHALGALQNRCLMRCTAGAALLRGPLPEGLPYKPDSLDGHVRIQPRPSARCVACRFPCAKKSICALTELSHGLGRTLGKYFDFYKWKRRNSSLDPKAPDDVYFHSPLRLLAA